MNFIILPAIWQSLTSRQDFILMLKYRKDIDGLRAIAILPVIFYHFFIPGFQGGFTGVDIFFVISGFLIGSLLLSGFEENKFSLAAFYERRIRRIVPALYTLIFSCLLFSFLFFDSSFLKELGRTAMATILFISNLLFYNTTTNYFAREGGGDLLLHTWSLAIEEQFYIFFPVFLFLVNKFLKKYVLHFIVLVLISSLTMSVLFTKGHAFASFYLPLTRAWELMTGVLIAKLKSSAISSKARQLLCFTGLLLLLFGFFRLDNTSVFPGYNALFPVAGAALIIYFGNSPGMLINRMLSLQVPVFIGKISYSLYLWHWPVKIFAGYFLPEPLTVPQILCLLVITFVLSLLSWKFIEQPFRRRKNPLSPRRKVFIIAATSTVLLLAFSSVIYLNNGFPGRSIENRLIDEAENDGTWKQTWDYADTTSQLSSTHTLARIGDRNATPDFILWGDSHAGMLTTGFNAAAREKRKSGFVAVIVGNPPVIPDKNRTTYVPWLGKMNASIIRFIAEHTEIRKIYISARWSAYRRGSLRDPVLKDALPFDHEFSRLLDTLGSLQREVIIIDPLPELLLAPRKYFFQSKFYNTPINSLTPAKDYLLSWNKPTQDKLNELTQHSTMRLIYLGDPLFNKGKVTLLDNNHFLYQDVHHLSYWGSMKLKDRIKEEL